MVSAGPPRDLGRLMMMGVAKASTWVSVLISSTAKAFDDVAIDALRTCRHVAEASRVEIAHRERPHGSWPCARPSDFLGLGSKCCLICGHELRRPRQSWQWGSLEATATKIETYLAMPVEERMN